jgi:hypothetical protein
MNDWISCLRSSIPSSFGVGWIKRKINIVLRSNLCQTRLVVAAIAQIHFWCYRPGGALKIIPPDVAMWTSETGSAFIFDDRSANCLLAHVLTRCAPRLNSATLSIRIVLSGIGLLAILTKLVTIHYVSNLTQSTDSFTEVAQFSSSENINGASFAFPRCWFRGRWLSTTRAHPTSWGSWRGCRLVADRTHLQSTFLWLFWIQFLRWLNSGLVTKATCLLVLVIWYHLNGIFFGHF